jgi:hypothetical protein
MLVFIRYTIEISKHGKCNRFLLCSIIMSHKCSSIPFLPITSATTLNSLSEDLISEILAHLHVKDIFRTRCVKKIME